MSELTKALVQARMALSGTVKKGGQNAHQKYAYVGHEHVIMGGARDALLKAGLTLEQREVTYVGEVPGGKHPALLWKGLHTLTHESGEERSYVFHATTQANDKAAFVASTSLDRTAHLRVLELAGSEEEDPEHDVHDGAPDPHSARLGVAFSMPVLGMLTKLARATEESTLASIMDEARARWPELAPGERVAIYKVVGGAKERLMQQDFDAVEAAEAERALGEGSAE